MKCSLSTSGLQSSSCVLAYSDVENSGKQALNRLSKLAGVVLLPEQGGTLGFHLDGRDPAAIHAGEGEQTQVVGLLRPGPLVVLVAVAPAGTG